MLCPRPARALSIHVLPYPRPSLLCPCLAHPSPSLPMPFPSLPVSACSCPCSAHPCSLDIFSNSNYSTIPHPAQPFPALPMRCPPLSVCLCSCPSMPIPLDPAPLSPVYSNGIRRWKEPSPIPSCLDVGLPSRHLGHCERSRKMNEDVYSIRTALSPCDIFQPSAINPVMEAQSRGQTEAEAPASPAQQRSGRARGWALEASDPGRIY